MEGMEIFESKKSLNINEGNKIIIDNKELISKDEIIDTTIHKKDSDSSNRISRSHSMDSLSNNLLLDINENKHVDANADPDHAQVHAPLKSYDTIAAVVNGSTRSSSYMNAVLTALQTLNKSVQKSYDLSHEDGIRKLISSLTDIETKYINAIDQCSFYLQSKDNMTVAFYNKGRYNAVRNTKRMLETELGFTSLIRSMSSEDWKAMSNEGQSVSFTDLVCTIQNNKENLVSKLGFQDFLKFSSDTSCESLICRNGRLFKLTQIGTTLENPSIATRENFLMADRLITILLEKQDTSSPLTKKKLRMNMLWSLGANMEKETAGPISMNQIRQLMFHMKAEMLDVDLAMADSETDQAKRQVAQRIDHLLGRPSSRDCIRDVQQQIGNIMNTCERTRKWSKKWEPTVLDERDMDSLLNGGIRIVRDRVFHSVLRIYENRKLLYPNQEDEQEPLSDRDLKILLGQAISEVAWSVREDKRNSFVYESRIRTLEEKFSLEGSTDYKKDLGTLQSQSLTHREDVQKEKSNREVKEVVSEGFVAKNIIDTFPDKAREVAEIFVGSKLPSSLPKQPGNQLCLELVNLYGILKNMQQNQSDKLLFNEVHINRTTLNLMQDEQGLLFLQSGSKKVVLPCTAAFWVRVMEDDVCANFKKYGELAGKVILKQLVQEDLKDEGIHRANFESFFTNYIGVKPELVNEYGARDLRALIEVYCHNSQITPKVLYDVFHLDNKRIAEPKLRVNSMAAQDCLAAMDRMEKKAAHQLKKENNRLVEFGKKQENPSSQQKKVFDFLGDMFFSDQWEPENASYDLDRLKKIISHNLEGFAEIMAMAPNDQAKLMAQFGGFAWFQSAVNAMINMAKKCENIIENKDDDDDEEEEIRPSEKSKQIQKQKRILGLKNLFSDKADKEQVNALENVLKDGINNLSAAEKLISEEMQNILRNSVSNLNMPTDNQWKGLDQLTIPELIEKVVNGAEGEGAFNQEVMSNYIKDASPVDRRKMIASVFKNGPYFYSVPKGTTSQQAMEIYHGQIIAGYIKGAGPLMHKTLQGIPISNMPLTMQKAVEDVRSSLNEIDERYVNAQLAQLVKESGNTIDHIEKGPVLGAASVGQTILIREYEKDATQGVEKAVKLLRPDAENHMLREQKFMIKCARNVDAKMYAEKNRKQLPAKDPQTILPAGYVGGMQKTINDKIEAIHKEFDLRLEADNVNSGSIYNDKLLHISSVKADPRARKKKDVLVLEKAPGVSVDKFMMSKDEERRQILARREKKVDSEVSFRAMKELDTLRKELKKKQRYLIDMSYKWIEEAIFKSGFFHGDLHAGNVMISNDGVTLIDYGNVDTFSENEQKHMANLIFATQGLNTERFANHLRGLLSKEARRIYDNKEDILYPKIRKILKKEYVGDPLQKIFIILNEFQKEGIEVPSKCNRFVQGLIRIYGMMDDYEKLIHNVDNNMLEIMETTCNGALEESLDSNVMPLVMKDILYLHDKKYKNKPKPQNLDERIDSLVNTVQYNFNGLKSYFQTGDTSLLRIDSNVERLSDILEQRDRIYHSLVCGHPIHQFRDLQKPIENISYITDDLFRVRYDSGCQGIDLRNAISHIVGHLKKFVFNMTDSTEQEIKFTEDVIDNRFPQKLSDFKEKYSVLLKDPDISVPYKVEMSHQYELEYNDLQKHTVLYKGYLQYYKALLATIKENENNIAGAIQNIQNKMVTPAYTRQQFVSDLDLFFKAVEPIFTSGCHDQDEEQYALGILNMAKTSKPFHNKETNANTDANANPNAAKEQSLELTPQDENRRKLDEETAWNQLQQSAQKVCEKTNPKTYKETLIETILDKTKRGKLEKTLKGWYVGREGAKLRAAYRSLVKAETDEQQLGEDSKQVQAFVNALVQCIKARARKLEEIVIYKNRKDTSTDQSTMAWRLFENHWYKALKYLDGGGIYYKFEHHLSQTEKDRLAQDEKTVHSNYVSGLYQSLQKSGLKTKTENLSQAVAKYDELARKRNPAASRDSLTKAIKQYNVCLHFVVKALADLNYSAPGKKLFRELLMKYEEAPCLRTMNGLISGMGNYIKGQFQNTTYTDSGKDIQTGQDMLSPFETVYSEKLSDVGFLIADDQLKFGGNPKDGKEQLKANGKTKSLLDLLNEVQKNQAIRWISLK